MDKLIQHLGIWEKIFMALALIAAVSVGMVNAKQGEDYAWQAVTVLWIISNWMKTNKIEELENK
jgi:hypothetical protein